MSCLLLPTKDVCIHFFTFFSLSYRVIKSVSPQFSFEFRSILFGGSMFALPGARLILSLFLLYLLSILLSALKGKKSKEKGKHQSQPGGPNITQGRKRAMQSSNSDHPTKKIRKEEHRVSSGKNFTDGRRKAKTNSAPLDKNICTSTSSSQLNANMETNHAIPQKNLRTAPVHNGLHSTEARVSKRKAASKQKHTVGGNHDQFEGRRVGVGSASHRQAYPGISVGIHHPLSERTQRPPPLREVGNAWQHHMDHRSIPCPNPTMVFEHPNAAPAGWRAPGYFREPPPDQRAAVFPPFNTSQTIYRRHPDGAYVMPQYRYSGGSNGFPR